MNRKWMRLSLGMLLFSGALWAQQTATSGIVGQVVDTTQAAIAGAAVTVTNTGTHAQRTAMTDAQGNFSIPNPQPATYEIRVEKMGFQTAVISAFDLLIGQIAHPTVTMPVGAVLESVNVQAEAPLLQSQSAEVGQVIDSKQIADLPLNGRSRTVWPRAANSHSPGKT